MGKYGWIDADLCVALGSGTHTNKFYVDYADKSCAQDCAAGTNNCAGHPSDLSIQLFDTAADCCANKLSYVNQDACESKSNTGTESAATGSNEESRITFQELSAWYTQHEGHVLIPWLE